jgi:hypothetical protein
MRRQGVCGRNTPIEIELAHSIESMTLNGDAEEEDDVIARQAEEKGL